MGRSQLQVNSDVRKVLARHWIDKEKVHCGCYHGVLRLSGELCSNRSDVCDVAGLCLVEALENELRRIRGVRRVQFDLRNWHRDCAGQWRPLHKSATPKKDTGANDTGVADLPDGPILPSVALAPTPSRVGC